MSENGEARGKQVTLYVGSCNKTNVLEADKLRKVLDRHLDGYTLDFGKGVWKGKSEDSVVVDVINPPSKDKMDLIASEIAKKLKQDVVLRVSDNVQYRFVSAKSKIKKVL